MTCIVGVVAKDGVWIGADAIAADTGQWFVRQERLPKVFHAGSALIGFTSSFRMGNLLRCTLKMPPEPKPNDALEPWLANQFVDALRETFKAAGWARKENEREEGGALLIGIRGRLFCLDSDYNIQEPAEGYAANGCGYPYAYGALHATRDLGWHARNRIRRALSAAAAHSAYVRGPFRILRAGV